MRKSCPKLFSKILPTPSDYTNTDHSYRFKQYKAVRQGKRLNLHHTIHDAHESPLVVLLRPGQLQTSHLPTGRRKLELKVAR